MTDPLDSLLTALDLIEGKNPSLWHSCLDASGAVVGCHPIGVNPKDPAAVEAWERRLLELCEAMGSVTAEPKPVPDFPGFEKLRRGD